MFFVGRNFASDLLCKLKPLKTFKNLNKPSKNLKTLKPAHFIM